MSDIIWTHDAPFASKDVCYYRSNDDTLCRVNFGGDQQKALTSRKITYSPFVSNDVVYFAADDHSLWSIGIDGQPGDERPVGAARSGSAPFVVGKDIYYQGDDNSLRSITTTGESDYQIGTSETVSTPVATDKVVIFQGTNGALWRQTPSATSTPTQLAGDYAGNHVLFETSAAPHLYNNYVYFRGTDDRVWQVSPNGKEIFQYNESVKTATTPVVDEDKLYAAPYETDIICVEKDRSTQWNLAYQSHPDSKPFAANGKLYIRGIDDHLWMVTPSPRTLDKISGLRVECNWAAYLCTVLMHGPHGAVGPVSPSLGMGFTGATEVDLTRASGLQDGSELCPTVSVDLVNEDHFAETNVMFDSSSPDVAYYTLTGSAGYPNWHYQGARTAIVKPARPGQSPTWCWVGSGQPIDPRPIRSAEA